MTKEQLLAEAMALDLEERVSLAEQLLVSLGRKTCNVIDLTWLDEVRRRERDFASGRMSTSSVDDAVGRLQRRSRRA